MDMDLSRGQFRPGSFIAGSVLLVFAALLGISILLDVLSFSGGNSAFMMPGSLLFSVYGFASFLVPCFFLFAAVLLLMPGWTVRSVIVLAGSLIPFFTVVGGEKLIRNYALALSSGNSFRFVFSGLVVSTLLAVLVEYLLLLQLGDHIVSSGKSLHAQNPGDQRDEELRFADDAAKPADISPDFGDGAFSDALPESADEDKHSFMKDFVPDIVEKDKMPESASEIKIPEESSPVFEPNELSVAQVESVSSAPALQISDEQDPLPVSDSPTYVDFEKMKAPFDLPIVEDWVAQSAIADNACVADSDMEKIAGSVPDSEEMDDPVLPEDFAGLDEIGDDEIPEETDFPEADENDRIEDSDETVDDDEISAADFDSDLTDCEVETPELPIENADATCTVSFDGLPPVVTVPPVAAAHAILPEDEPGFAKKLFRKRTSRAYSVPYDILNSYPDGEYWIIDDTTRRAAIALKETLNEFRIQADVTGIRKGPVITMFEILPAPGVKLSKIVGLQDNIALRLAASSVRIVAPIPGKHAVGIEVPNEKRAIVSFRELIETDTPAAKKMEIPVILGKDITGEAQLLDLAATPHLLIAGSTGSGKSVCVNAIILSILYKRSPEDVKLILIDPKIVELKLYNDIAHLLAPVITEPKKAFQALQYCLCEMERRYALLDGMGVRDIKSYNRRIKERDIATEKLPYIVIIIDEFADLMATTGKELESTVARLCAMSRAVGIHLVLATQRPSIDVITGLIKANIPTRIAFMVASKMDSRIIIDQVGAEKLLGRGDMLYAGAVDPFPVRIQGAYVSEEEVERVVEHVKTLGEPEYIDEEMFVDDDEDSVIDSSLFNDGDDPLYDKALEIVILAGKASASYIQRKLKIGYNRAARLVEEMEARGIVGPANGSKPREIVHHP